MKYNPLNPPPYAVATAGNIEFFSSRQAAISFYLDYTAAYPGAAAKLFSPTSGTTIAEVATA